MGKPTLGILVGAVLGALDGLSAWFSPDAQPIFLTIVVSSTLKGLVTGLLAGLVARRWRSTGLGVASGLVFGLILSTLAAVGQGGHYAEIVLPGMLVGALTGYVTQRYPESSATARGSRRAAIGVLVTLAASPLAGMQPSPATPDPLAALAPLIGRWTGTSEGQPGRGTVEREYERALGNRFIRVRNRSTYPPQEKNVKGEVHQDEGWFSFDRARKRIVLRQFHVEGFVNQYVEDGGASPRTIVFTSEAIENIPAGFKARETYTFIGPDEFEEVFELAEPGQPFAVYSRTRLRRVNQGAATAVRMPPLISRGLVVWLGASTVKAPRPAIRLTPA